MVLSISSYASTVSIGWNASPSTGLSSYKIYKANGATGLVAGTIPSSNPNAVFVGTIPSSQLTGVISNLTDGQWSFSVTALSTNGLESVFGNVVSANILNLPAAPTGLVAAALSTSQIKLNWTDNASNESGYSVERSIDNTSFTVVANLGANTVTYTDSGLSVNTLYYYKVRASNASGNSLYSAIVSSRTLDVVAPAAPTNLRIQLTWNPNAPADNVTQYKIYLSIGTNPFSVVGNSTVPSFTITVDPTQSLRYYITAVNSSGIESQPSQIINL